VVFGYVLAPRGAKNVSSPETFSPLTPFPRGKNHSTDLNPLPYLLGPPIWRESIPHHWAPLFLNKIEKPPTSGGFSPSPRVLHSFSFSNAVSGSPSFLFQQILDLQKLTFFFQQPQFRGPPVEFLSSFVPLLVGAGRFFFFSLLESFSLLFPFLSPRCEKSLSSHIDQALGRSGAFPLGFKQRFSLFFRVPPWFPFALPFPDGEIRRVPS